MEEGTLKTPIPKYRLYLSFLFGCCGNFVGSQSGQKESVKPLQNMAYNTTQHPSTPTATHCLYILYIYFGKGGEVREKVDGQQYTCIVPSSMNATIHKLGLN